MKMRILNVLLINGFAVALCQTEPFLDVTVLKVPKSTSKGSSQGGQIISGCLGDTGRPCDADLPVKISILSIDKLDYRLDEPMVFEVRIENVGDKPLSMPWTLDWRLAERRNARPNSLLVAVIVPLVVDRANGKNAIDRRQFRSVLLFGSLDVPGTSVSIPPGGTARLRVSSASLFRTEKVVFPLETSVKAKLTFQEGPFSRNFASAVSSNSVPVTILQVK